MPTLEIESYKLLTRQQIIDVWSKQKKEYLESYCCPECRDLLFKTEFEDIYECQNPYCKITAVRRE